MKRTCSGDALNRIDMIIALIPTLLPEPVKPPISRCGMRCMSATNARPWMSLPSASVSGEAECTNFEDSTNAFDPKYDLVLEIAQEHHGRSAATAAEWADRLASGAMEERFKDRGGNLKPARARATLVGSLFGEYLDARFAVDGRRFRLVREYPEGEGRKPTYRFLECAA